MRNSRRVLAALSVAAAATVSAGGVSAASAEVTGDSCAVVIAKAPEGKTSPTLAEACSTTPAKAIAAASRQAGQRTGNAAAVDVIIMEAYDDVDYGFPYFTVVGHDGPCDTAGYRWEPNSEWKNKISSILGYNGCDKVRVTNKALTSAKEFTAFYNGTAHWLGAYSDNVGLAQPHA
jgi:hypothetical protein